MGCCSEIVVWSSLSHPNILPFLGTCHVKPDYLGLVYPFRANGDINKYIAGRSDANVMLLVCVMKSAFFRSLRPCHSFSWLKWQVQSITCIH